eukprot:6987826-Pyramimonas_sp.AAC.1
MKSKLLELQTSLGINYVPTGVLQDPDLDTDLPQVLTWDYMRVYLVGGVFVVEFSSPVTGSEGNPWHVLAEVGVARGVRQREGRLQETQGL